MFKIRSIVAALSGFVMALLFGPPVFRARTCDVAFGYRMGAGFPGDINRTHPFSVMPGLINGTTPPRLFGDPVLADTNTYRGFVAGDQSATALAIDGVTVRSYPTQQASGGMSSALGAATPPVSGVMDALRMGYIMVKLPAGATVSKGSPAWVWCTATAGNNIQGGFVAAASAGNTVPVNNAAFTGPADATGIAELEVWPG